MEDIRQTQKIHSAMLQSIQKQLQTTSRMEAVTLPESVKFPLATMADVDALEATLSDVAVKDTLVIMICHSCTFVL
jgi:hypothetical protein